MTERKVARRRIGKVSKSKPTGCFFQLKMTLWDAPLPIWRRVLINAHLPLSVVHQILQICMGWWNYHLHDFSANGRHFGDIHTADGDEKVEDDTKHTLFDLLHEPGKCFLYDYDFGDSWHHSVEIEKIHVADKVPFAACTAGRRACPPEDVGGVDGYRRFLEIIEDPEHEEREERLNWAGGDFDPDSFDVRIVNLRLELLRQELLSNHK